MKKVEHDSLGTIEVEADKLWGAQTERSRRNFKFQQQNMPTSIILAFAELKKAAAKVNEHEGRLSSEKASAIQVACNDILAKKWLDQFPLSIYQTGSGTQTNMNVNEVIANLANQRFNELKIHPNDDVNMSQSSNDTFPTAMHIAGYHAVRALIGEIEKIVTVLTEKQQQYNRIVKIGRTHLQDAVPLTLGQEMSGWKEMVVRGKQFIETSSTALLSLAIGGTAVGTGLNASYHFGRAVAKVVSRQTGYPFTSEANKFFALTSHSPVNYVHGAIRSLASDLHKIANDIRLLASGPRSGLGELNIPTNEPGSSIMPGKVNPTQCESLTMVVAQIIGNDATINFAASQGQLELNVYKPVIAANFLQSVELLTASLHSFRVHCLVGLEANEEIINELVERSFMLVTALNPHIGYEKAAEIVKKASQENMNLRDAAVAMGYLTAAQFDQWVNPLQMTNVERTAE